VTAPGDALGLGNARMPLTATLCIVKTSSDGISAVGAVAGS